MNEIQSIFDPSWKDFLENETTQIFLNELCTSFRNSLPLDQVFRVFRMPLDQIKVVFLGKEPYLIPEYSNGLAFSVTREVPIPSETLNLFKEIQHSFPQRRYHFTHGNLERWSLEEGVFLLNQALTVQPLNPQSHLKRWTPFIQHVLKYIAQIHSDCIFVFFGTQGDQWLQRRYKSRWIECPFPTAPGFGGCMVFREIENKLDESINWGL